MSTASIATPVRPYGPTRQFRGELWTCNASGERDKNITNRLLGCSVSINWLGDIKSTMRAQLLEPVVLRPLIDFLQPRMIIEWHDIDGFSHYVDEPLGVFNFLMPNQTSTEYYTTSEIEGVDSLYLLAQLTSDSLQWFGANTNYGAAARTLLAGAGSGIPLSLPDTPAMIDPPRTVRANDYLLKSAVDLYDTAEFWDLAATRHGTVTTSARTTLGDSTAGRQLITRDVAGDIQHQPDRDAFCNQIFLTSNNPEADLSLRDGYKISFVDPASPWSTVNSKVVSKSISDSRDVSFDTMRRRAIMMLESAAGTQERIIVPHMPDPRFDIREPWELDIKQRTTTNNIVAKGMFRVEAMTFGLTPDDIAQVTTLSHLVPTSTFFEG